MFRQREEGGEVEKDFLKKQLQKLVQAIQRVLKLSSEQQHQQAEDELQQIAATSLKLDATRLGSLDVASCAMILGTPERLRLYAVILRAEAELARARGQTQRARDRLVRAQKLHQLADARSPTDELSKQEQAHLADLLSR